MVEVSDKVRKLLASYKSLKGSKSRIPEIRTQHSTLQTKWEEFEKTVSKITSNMEISLKFHTVLFEVSH